VPTSKRHNKNEDYGMRLFSATASPYSRKVRVAMIELGLADKIETVAQSPRDGASGFFAINPLAKIPALQTDDSGVLFDSPVICEYLNALVGGSLIPAAGKARWDALRREAIGDGILDTAMPLRGELLRPAEQRSSELIDRQRATVNRTLGVLDQGKLPSLDTVDIGTIAIGCALGWLDFRFADWGWQANCPKLAAWQRTLNQRASFAATAPA
jgi:glutathione S-transferase